MRSISLVGLDVHAAQTHAAVLERSTGELRGGRLRMPPIEVVEFWRGCPARCRRSMRPDRPGSGWRARPG